MEREIRRGNLELDRVASGDGRQQGPKKDFGRKIENAEGFLELEESEFWKFVVLENDSETRA